MRMLQTQTPKPARILNRSANIRTDKSTPNLMMTRVLQIVFQPLITCRAAFASVPGDTLPRNRYRFHT
jgi:hypothetical protein